MTPAVAEKFFSKLKIIGQNNILSTQKRIINIAIYSSIDDTRTRKRLWILNVNNFIRINKHCDKSVVKTDVHTILCSRDEYDLQQDIAHLPVFLKLTLFFFFFFDTFSKPINTY